jgi:hypothetical protein
MTTIRTENQFPNVQPPAGAVTVYEWENHPFTPMTADPDTGSADGGSRTEGGTRLTLTAPRIGCDAARRRTR